MVTCRTQQVQGRADNGLIRLKVDTGYRQQTGVDDTGGNGAQEYHDHHQERGQTGHVPHSQRTAQGADDHDALKAQIDDAGMLGEAAAQRY